MNNLELKVLSLIINDLADLTIRRDRTYYRLQLTINCTKFKLSNPHLDCFIGNLKESNNYYFNYDNSNNRYYIYGNKVIELLELIIERYLYIVLCSEFLKKVQLLLENKFLFTRSSGKKYTEEERNKIEDLYQQFKSFK